MNNHTPPPILDDAGGDPTRTERECEGDLLDLLSGICSAASSLLFSAALLWMLTPVQAARRAGISTSLIYQLCNERRLPHFRIGGDGRRGKLLIDEADLETFLASCRVDANCVDESVPLKHIR